MGKFSLTVNFFLYAACLVLFVPEVAIYSVIYNFFSAMVLDRMHQQNVNVQAMIFTKEDEKELGRFIIEKLGRSVTYWEGTGAYSGEGGSMCWWCACPSSRLRICSTRSTSGTTTPSSPSRSGSGSSGTLCGSWSDRGRGV